MKKEAIFANVKSFTMRDIARQSGLSIATVSRILSGKGGHTFSTVKHLERVIGEMGMKMNLFCPGLECVGIITHTTYDSASSPYSTALLSQLERELALNGFLSLLIPVIPSRLSLSYIRRIIDAHRLAGLVVLERLHMEKLGEAFGSLPIPCVWVGNSAPESLPWQVACDNFGAGVAAAELLQKAVHSRNVGIISVNHPDECHLLRQRGFGSTWAADGKGRISWRFDADFSGEDGPAMVRQLEDMPLSRRPGAIFSTNSALSAELLRALEHSPLQAGRDFELLSVEDDNELAQYAGRISLLRQPCREMGRAGARMMLSLIHGETPQQPRLIIKCGLFPAERFRQG